MEMMTTLKASLTRKSLTRDFVSTSPKHGLRNEEGSQLMELALVLPFLLFLLFGTIDFGRAYYVYLEVSSAAEAGAFYGLSNPTDTSGMQAAASLNAQDLTSLTPVASYGAECLDGTQSTSASGTAPVCSYGAVQYVEVDTTSTYTPLLPYPGIPASITLTGKSRMRATF